MTSQILGTILLNSGSIQMLEQDRSLLGTHMGDLSMRISQKGMARQLTDLWSLSYPPSLLMQ